MRGRTWICTTDPRWSADCGAFVKLLLRPSPLPKSGLAKMKYMRNWRRRKKKIGRVSPSRPMTTTTTAAVSFGEHFHRAPAETLRGRENAHMIGWIFFIFREPSPSLSRYKNTHTHIHMRRSRAHSTTAEIRLWKVTHVQARHSSRNYSWLRLVGMLRDSVSPERCNRVITLT